MQKTGYPAKRKAARLFPHAGVRFLRRFRRDPRHLWLRLKRRARGERLIVIVGTGHRVGSTWLYHMVKDLGHFEQGIKHIPREFRRSGTILPAPTVFECIRDLQGYMIFKTHELPKRIKDLTGSAKFLSIYRDPRDVLVSASFYMAHLEEEKGGWGEGFRRLPETERIRMLMEKSDLFEELKQWFRAPFAHRVRYEDLKRQPVDVLRAISEYLGLPVGDDVERVVLRHSFESRTGRKPGQEDEASSTRKGVVGDWRQYFDRETRIMFGTEQGGRWSKLLVEMGYENTLDWE